MQYLHRLPSAPCGVPRPAVVTRLCGRAWVHFCPACIMYPAPVAPLPVLQGTRRCGGFYAGTTTRTSCTDTSRRTHLPQGQRQTQRQGQGAGLPAVGGARAALSSRSAHGEQPSSKRTRTGKAEAPRSAPYPQVLEVPKSSAVKELEPRQAGILDKFVSNFNHPKASSSVRDPFWWYFPAYAKELGVENSTAQDALVHAIGGLAYETMACFRTLMAGAKAGGRNSWTGQGFAVDAAAEEEKRAAADALDTAPADAGIGSQDEVRLDVQAERAEAERKLQLRRDVEDNASRGDPGKTGGKGPGRRELEAAAAENRQPAPGAQAADDTLSRAKAAGGAHAKPGGTVPKPANSGAGVVSRSAVSQDPEACLAYGLHIVMPTRCFKQMVRTLVDEEGNVSSEAILCNVPGFDRPGLTLEATAWETDGEGNLVLGYHNGSTPAGPLCLRSGTIPVVITQGRPRVPPFAVQKVRDGKFVFRNTHNTRERNKHKQAMKASGTRA